MADTTYVDGQQPLIYAAWLNDINNVAYRVLGSGGAVPTTVAQLLANLGLTGTITVGGNNSFTGTNSFAGPTTFTGAATFNDTVTHEGTETFNVGSVLDLLGSLNVSGLASFTGTVALGGGATATTAAVGTNTTQVATTAFVEQYPALINNTSASSDISLAVGQGCYIDVAGATTVPLHVATGDNQAYEILLSFEVTTAGGAASLLLLNNTTYANQFYQHGIYGDGSSTGSSAGYGSSCIVSQGCPSLAALKISTKTAGGKQVITNYFSNVSGTNYSGQYETRMCVASAGNSPDTTTALTSLGTFTFPAAVTGRVFIRRTA